MASADLDPEDPDKARPLLVRLLEEGDYRITDRARNDGFPILRVLGVRDPLDGSLVDFVLRLLRRGHPIRRMIRGEPPDSLPRGWCMKNCDGHGLFIELTIEEVRMGQQVAFLISFHN
jgi:hypothetical protein